MIRLSTAMPSSHTNSGSDTSSLFPIVLGEGRERLYTGSLNQEFTLDRESKAQNTTPACLPQTSAFATLETRRELQPKCVLQLFLGLSLGTRRSAIGHFFPLSLVTVPEVFAKVNPTQFPSCF